MATTRSVRRTRKKQSSLPRLSESFQAFCARRIFEAVALSLACGGAFLTAALLSYDPADPSWNTAGDGAAVSNWMGLQGAWSADILLQTLGGAGFLAGLSFIVWSLRMFARHRLGPFPLRVVAMLTAGITLSVAFALIPAGGWLSHAYLGGAGGTLILGRLAEMTQNIPVLSDRIVLAGLAGAIALGSALYALAVTREEMAAAGRVAVSATVFLLQALYMLGAGFYHWVAHYNDPDYGPERERPSFFDRFSWPSFDGLHGAWARILNPPEAERQKPRKRRAPSVREIEEEVEEDEVEEEEEYVRPAPAARAARIPVIAAGAAPALPKSAPDQHRFALSSDGEEWEFPPLDLLAEEQAQHIQPVDENALRRNAELLQNVLNDFKIEGDIVKIHPGPVVTLYEFEPAPGTKSSRVIGLSDDIARSMSAVSVRCAVVPGRSVIGIELPNQQRQIVYMRELLACKHFERYAGKLPLILGKDIGGQPIMADLAKMPHLLVAGTTGSGKSVAVNTMILSLLYRLSPEQCRFIMIDPKMLELSVYDDIPHLLSPVVTEPGKAVVALKWTVQEMEERYRAMSKLGVRNIEGYNQRLAEARENGETIMRKVATGFDPETGKEIYESQPMDLTELPYIVVVVDEFADLMLVAGKDVENAIQRLAQMARAAGIHLIMATQRPSVDVITGVIKANFPTRISFAVTSKIDSRTILGEGGAEQLLGMGDMLYMAPGGRITRVHGPFVADEDVENVVGFLKSQAEPAYMEEITEGGDFGGSEIMGALFGDSGDNSVDELYDQAVAIVAREGKASTSFIQRYLQIGYNRAARIIEEMERQGVVSKASPTGKREVLVRDHSDA